jgi:hypothetical protein
MFAVLDPQLLASQIHPFLTNIFACLKNQTGINHNDLEIICHILITESIAKWIST